MPFYRLHATAKRFGLRRPVSLAVLVIAVALAGCAGDQAPTAPITTAAALAPATGEPDHMPATSQPDPTDSTIGTTSPAKSEATTTSASAGATSTGSTAGSHASTPTTAPPADAGVPDEPPSLEGMFISVVVSATSRTAAEAESADLAERFDVPIGILLSDDFPSLNPGYWVVYAGPFATAEEAQNACWSDLNLRTAARCYGRRLSQDPRDGEISYPPAPVGDTTAAPTTAPSTTAPTPETGLSAAEVYQRVAPSIAYIVNGAGTGAGSGILIEDGYVITNYHVVEPYDVVWRVVFPDRAEFWNVPVIGWAPWADLAVLGPVKATAPPLSLRNGEGMAPGSDVFLVGYPAEVEQYPQASISQGILSRVYEETMTDLTVLRTDATTVGGQSGGAMVDDRGRVIGITTRVRTTAGVQAFTEAYSASDYTVLLHGMVEPSGVTPGTTGGGSAPDRPRSQYPRALDGTFVSVVVSATSAEAAERARDDLEGRFGFQFGILLSDDFESLNPGYWVVYLGPFATAEESAEACWFDLNMQSAARCYGRRLSQDPADRDVVYPPTAGAYG